MKNTLFALALGAAAAISQVLTTAQQAPPGCKEIEPSDPVGLPEGAVEVFSDREFGPIRVAVRGFDGSER